MKKPKPSVVYDFSGPSPKDAIDRTIELLSEAEQEEIRAVLAAKQKAKDSRRKAE